MLHQFLQTEGGSFLQLGTHGFVHRNVSQSVHSGCAGLHHRCMFFIIVFFFTSAGNESFPSVYCLIFAQNFSLCMVLAGARFETVLTKYLWGASNILSMIFAAAIVYACMINLQLGLLKAFLPCQTNHCYTPRVTIVRACPAHVIFFKCECFRKKKEKIMIVWNWRKECIAHAHSEIVCL